MAREIVTAARDGERLPRDSTSPPAFDVTPVDGLTTESVFHDAALRYLDQQVVTNDQLDARGAQNFQVGSTVVTITFVLLSLSRAETPDRAEYSLWGALGAYGLVLSLSFAACVFRKTAYRPDIPTVRRYIDDLTGNDLQLWVALEYVSSTEINERLLRRKSWLVAAATLFLYVKGACLAVAALFTPL